MDPVSIACAVVTLGTFIKDAIELAQKILEKVPKSRKKLRNFSADLIRGLIDLGQFYDQHKNHLDVSADLEINAVHTHCSQLFPSRSSSRIDNVVAAIHAWNKWDEIEKEILDLKERVQGCYIRFTAFSAARLEQSTYRLEHNTTHIEKNTSRIEHSTTRVERTLLVLHAEQRSGLSRIESRLRSYSRRDSSDVGLSSPIGSNEASLLGDIPKLYLHQQVEAIAKSLEHLASSKTFKGEEPRGRYLFPFRVAFSYAEFLDTSSIHRQVVIGALQILQLLQDDSAQLSVQDGARDMIHLAIGLHHLQMYEDAVTIGAWTVDLYRTLCKTHAPVFEPYLALALQNVSLYCSQADDLVKATLAIEESVKIHRALLSSSTSDFRPRLASSLRSFSEIHSDKGEPQKRLEFAQESVEIFQNVLHEAVAWESWETQIRSKREPPQYGNQSENSQTSTEDSIADFAHCPSTASARYGLRDDYDASLVLESNMAFAFRNLARSLDDVGRHSEAYEKEKVALAMFRDLYSRHRCFAPHLAESLCHLFRPWLTFNRPRSDMLSLVEDAVQIYRDLCSSHPKFLAKLFDSLWYQAVILWDSGDADAAFKVSNETIELIRQSHVDRRMLADSLSLSSWALRILGQHNDAVKLREEAVDIYRDLVSDPSSTKLVPKIMPAELLKLAQDLQIIGRLDKAIIANREAVERYRLIALNDSIRTPDLANALSSLLNVLNKAGKHDEASNVGQEVLKLYQALLRNYPDLINPFIIGLQRYSSAVYYSDDPQAITRSAEIAQNYRTLKADYSDVIGWDHIDALSDHGFILEKHRRYLEALHNSEEAVGIFQSIPMESAETATKFITSFLEHAYMLHVAGHVKKATNVIKDAITVVEPFVANSAELVVKLADAFCNMSEYLHMSGLYEDALASGEESLELARRHTSFDDTWFACKLNTSCECLVEAGRFADAVAIGNEAVALCRTSTSKDCFAAARLPLALERLSVCIAEAGDESKALGLVQEAVDLYQEIRSKNTVPWSFVEDIYADALVNLSIRLAANGRLHDAIQHGILAKNIYESVTASGRMASYPSLVTTLHFLSIFFCAVGRHAEGAAAVCEIVNKQRHLGLVHPEVAVLVQVALRERKTRPSYLAFRQTIPECNACNLSPDV